MTEVGKGSVRIDDRGEIAGGAEDPGEAMLDIGDPLLGGAAGPGLEPELKRDQPDRDQAEQHRRSRNHCSAGACPA